MPPQCKIINMNFGDYIVQYTVKWALEYCIDRNRLIMKSNQLNRSNISIVHTQLTISLISHKK